MGNILSPEAGPLFDAIAEGDAAAAVKALEANPRLSQRRAGKKCRTLYHACASTGGIAVLKRLCEHVWQTLPDEFGRTNTGSIPEGRFHPVIYRAANSYDELGLTPLMLACKKGHSEVVRYLLSQGANPWLGDRLLGRSALHHAARANQHMCIEAILTSPYVELDSKVRSKECRLVDHPNSSGYTPLHYAATSRCADAAIALFRHGANPNAKTFDVGFDFIQLDRGSTPLHAAARFQNVDLAMALLKYWDENLRERDVTDPRVVENYERVKPYQINGVRLNKPLARVLDPNTLIKEISDPFGEAGKPYAVPYSKGGPLKQTSFSKLQEGPQTGGIIKGSNDQAPPGWEDLLPISASANGASGRPAGGDFITVYQCAEFAADIGTSLPAVPPAADGTGKAASTDLGLLRTQSDGRRVTLKVPVQSSATATSGPLTRTRSGAAIHLPRFDGFGAYRSNSSKCNNGNGRSEPQNGLRRSPGATDATPPAEVSSVPPMSPSRSIGNIGSPTRLGHKSPPGVRPLQAKGVGGPVSEGQLPSPSSWMQPLTPPRADMATDISLRSVRSMGRDTDTMSPAGGGLTRAASDAAAVAFKPRSPDGAKSTPGRPFSTFSSNKPSGDGVPYAAAKVVLSPTQARVRGGATGRDSSGNTEAPSTLLPPTVFSAWCDNTHCTSRGPKNGAKATASTDRQVANCTTATTAVPYSKPVEITMYPYRLESLEPFPTL